MPTWLRRLLLTLAVATLAGIALEPFARAGFVGEDLPTLVDAGRLAWPERRESAPQAGSNLAGESTEDLDGQPAPLRLADLYGVHGTEERPLAALSLALSSRLESKRGRWTPERAIWPRLENLLLLLFAAIFLRAFVKRAMVPWTGSESARAAGTTAAVLFFLHPLTFSVVPSAAARGDCIGMMLAFGASALFLRGRQERRPSLVVLSGLLAASCAFASPLCMFLPPALAAVEMTSARRYRPLRTRLRTAVTTLIVFTGAITLESLVRYALADGGAAAPDWVQSFAVLGQGGDARRAFGYAVEKMGVLLFPVNTHGVGLFSYLLAGALLLAALQPVLVAARSAPRLWTWVAVLFSAALLFSVLPEALVRVHPKDWANARALFPGAAVMAVGLAVAGTSLSGVRRMILPIFLAIGFAILAHGNARPFERAAGAVRDLSLDVEAARAEHGYELPVLVVDPQPFVGGLDAVRPTLPALLDSAFLTRRADPSVRPAVPPLLRGLSFDAFRLYTRTDEFKMLRASGVILVYPRALLQEGVVEGTAVTVEPREERQRASVHRLSSLLQPASASDSQDSGTRLWRGEGRSPVLDLDPFERRSLRVRALPDTVAEEPVAEWRSRAELAERGRAVGAWTKREDGSNLVMFDLERSMPWLIGGRLRRVWFEGALAALVSAELLEEAPVLAGLEGLPAPRLRDDRWVLDGALPEGKASTILERIAGGLEEEHLVLEVLDLETLEHFSAPARLRLAENPLLESNISYHIEVPLRALSASPGSGLAGIENEENAEQRSALLWSLDHVKDGQTLSRWSGRGLSL